MPDSPSDVPQLETPSAPADPARADLKNESAPLQEPLSVVAAAAIPLETPDAEPVAAVSASPDSAAEPVAPTSPLPSAAVEAAPTAVEAAPDVAGTVTASETAEVESPQLDSPIEPPKPDASPPARRENPALALVFSPAPDAPFQSSLALTLSCARPNAQIFYALGARELGQNALRFDLQDKILLTSTIDIAARACENGEWGPLLVGTFEVKKALWQEIEPADPTDATSHKLSENGHCADGWKISAGSVRGKLHAHRGNWREDAFGLAEARSGERIWQIAAVSDGAGSAPLSRVGSQIACASALAALQTTLVALPAFSPDQSELQSRDLPLLRDALTAAARAALENIRQEAARRTKPLTAFAATLLILVRSEWNGAQLCAGLQVGDGAIALWDEAGLTLLGEADHGQHSSETRFLTTGGIEAELASRVKFSIKKELRAFALLSDGVSDDYFPEDRRLGEVFEAVLPLLAAPDGGAALVSWLGYEKKGSSDDRTLVVGWKDAAPSGIAKIDAVIVANEPIAAELIAATESGRDSAAGEVLGARASSLLAISEGKPLGESELVETDAGWKPALPKLHPPQSQSALTDAAPLENPLAARSIDTNAQNAPADTALAIESTAATASQASPTEATHGDFDCNA